MFQIARCHLVWFTGLTCDELSAANQSAFKVQNRQTKENKQQPSPFYDAAPSAQVISILLQTSTSWPSLRDLSLIRGEGWCIFVLICMFFKDPPHVYCIKNCSPPIMSRINLCDPPPFLNTNTYTHTHLIPSLQ